MIPPALATEPGVTVAHVGIAVTSIADAAAFYRDVLGLPTTPPETADGATVVSVRLGSSHVELLEASDPESPIGRFFLAHTKAELYEGALQRRVMLYPTANCEDTLQNVQLQARDFWVNIEHPELGDTITYPGAFFNASETPWRMRRRAPLLGEHNEEIYGKELGLSPEELVALKQSGVV